MIPEEARLEIVRRKNLGETWTGIARWLEAEHGINVHRTTVQRWYDREVYLDEEIDDEFSTEDRVKLDKKIETYKAESRFWKKLYETAIKDSTKKELIIDGKKIDISKLEVNVHEIPYVRLRYVLGDILHNTNKNSLLDIVKVAQQKIDDTFGPIQLNVNYKDALLIVNQYKIPMPAKNSAIFLDKGAPPDIKNLIFPPNLALTLLYINLSATLYFIFIKKSGS